jgi:hypothetical protein
MVVPLLYVRLSSLTGQAVRLESLTYVIEGRPGRITAATPASITAAR